MKTYTLKLNSGTAYKLYDGTTLVSDTDLGTLFGAAGSAYFVFDFNSGTPSSLTAVSITNSNNIAVMGITGLAAGTVKENYNFKGSWDGVSVEFTSFAELTGKAMDEAETSFLMSKIKEGLGNLGKAKQLTSADYDYPTTGTPTSVALWKLDPGVYWKSSSSIATRWNTTSDGQTSMSNARIFIIGGNKSSSHALIAISNDTILTTMLASDGGATTGFPKSFLNGQDNLVNNLTSTSTTSALTANQGKVLKDLVDSLAFKNAGAPTTATVGTVGQLLEDTTNGKLYICTAADTVTPSYTWVEVGAGGSGPTVVQSTGTSQTDVMSQNATTSMVYADPGVKRRICIGPNASASSDWAVAVGERANGGVYAVAIGSSDDNNYNTRALGQSSIAIGYDSRAEKTNAIAIGNASRATGLNALAIGDYSEAIGNGSVAIKGTASQGSAISIKGSVTAAGAIAIGQGAAATAQGQFDIGSSNTIYGYNNSNYRLLTGLYDGQSAHDAATYGQLSTAIINGGTTAPTTSTVGAVGTLYNYVDTTGATPEPHLMVCTVADTVTPSYTWVDVMGSVANALNVINNGTGA